MAKNTDGIITLRPRDKDMTRRLMDLADKKEWSLNKYIIILLEKHLKKVRK